MKAVMKSIVMLGAAVVAAVALVNNSLIAEPGKGAYLEWERGVFGSSHDFYVPCLDETFLVEFELPFMTRIIQTPNGGWMALFKYLPNTPRSSGYITLTGLESGKIFRAPNGAPALSDTWHIGPGEIYTLRSHERYVADDGTRLTIDWHFRFVMNANGEVVMNVELFECRVQ